MLRWVARGFRPECAGARSDLTARKDFRLEGSIARRARLAHVVLFARTALAFRTCLRAGGKGGKGFFDGVALGGVGSAGRLMDAAGGSNGGGAAGVAGAFASACPRARRAACLRFGA